jgi:hypothetical protein
MEHLPPFGPLSPDSCTIVSSSSLPWLVLQTALHANTACGIRTKQHSAANWQQRLTQIQIMRARNVRDNHPSQHQHQHQLQQLPPQT